MHLILLTSVVMCPHVFLQDDAGTDEAAAVPILRVNSGGPADLIRAMSFSPDGQKLYAGSRDRLIHVWERSGESFEYDADAVFRVPIGGNNLGEIYDVAVSRNGNLLAAAGSGYTYSSGDAAESGFAYLRPAGVFSDTDWTDYGTIYVFDMRTRAVQMLKGHKGRVFSLAFVELSDDDSPILISAGRVRDESASEIIAWDTASGRELAKVTAPAMAEPLTPHFVGWGTASDLNVLIAWGDQAGSGGGFGVKSWNLKTNRLSKQLADVGSIVLDLSRYAPDDSQVLASVLGAQESLLQVWTLSPGPNVRKRVINRSGNLMLASDAMGQPKPTGVASVSLKGQEWTLEVRDAAGRLADSETICPKAKLDPQYPILATAETGEWVAALGAANEIRLFRFSEQLSGNATPRTLRPPAGFSSVRFATSGGETGLLLTAPDLTSAAFNLSTSEIEEASEWSAAPASPEGWKIDVADPRTMGQPLEISVEGSGRTWPVVRIPAENDTEILQHIDSCICARDGDSPVLAIVWMGSYRRGMQKTIQIYDLEKGELIRQFTGHDGQVTSVALSPNGRLLASCSEDRTVRVWLVADINQNRRKYSILRDGNTLLAVDSANDGVVVSDGIGALQDGEKITSLEIEGEKFTPQTPREFYDAVFFHKPGTVVSVTTNAGVRSIRSGEAIDLRRPLFTLFLDTNKDWLAWHPSGIFDSSGRDVETQAGWHFNTGEEVEPVRYASLSQYRNLNFREGLIPQLLENEELPPVQPPPEPDVSFFFENEGLQDDRVPVFNAAPKYATLQLDELPPGGVTSISWSLPGFENGRQIACVQEGRTSWTALLENNGVSLPPGLHTLQVTLDAPAYPDTLTYQTQFRLQAPPPVIKFEEFDYRQKQEDFLLQLTSGTATEVRVIHYNEVGRKLSESEFIAADADGQVNASIPLAPGYNRLEVFARNVGTHEETRQVKAVELVRTDAKPPEIEIDTVGPIVTESPVVVAGRIRFPDAPGEATLKLNGNLLRTLDVSQTSDGVLRFREDVTLEPGRQQIDVTAAGKDGTESRQQIEIDFAPGDLEFDQITIRRIAKDDGVQIPGHLDPGPEFAFARTHQQRVQFSANVLGGVGELRFRLRRNGTEEPIDAVATDSTFSANVDLDPGSNRIQLLVEDSLGRRLESAEQEVTYLALPQVVEIDPGMTETDGQFASISCTVASPSRILPESIELLANDVPVPTTTDPTVMNTGERWLIRFQDISLPSDPVSRRSYKLAVTCRNEDGQSFMDETQSVTVRPTATAPTVDILSPTGRVTSSEVSVSFRVSFTRALRSADVYVNGMKTYSVPRQKLETAEAVGRLSDSTTVSLREGENDIRVLTMDEAGMPAQASQKVNRINPPWRLTSIAIGDQESRPGIDSAPQFRTFAKSSQVIAGTLKAPPGTPGDRKRFVQVAVNGFYRTTELERSDRETYTFELPISLTQTKDNLVVVRFFNDGTLIRDENRPESAMLVDCANPNDQQQLHLLLVEYAESGPVPVTSEDLRKSALDALRAMEDEQGGVSSTTFKRIILYPPRDSAMLTGARATRGRILGQLATIRNEIGDARGVEDVVMLYYRGVEKRTPKGFYLETADKDREMQLTSNLLADQLGNMEGAHLLLMDVQSDENSTRWSRDPRLGLLRIASLQEFGGEGNLISELRRGVRETSSLSNIAALIEERLRNKPALPDLSVPLELANLRLGAGGGEE